MPPSFTPLPSPEKLASQFFSLLAFREPPARFILANSQSQFSRIFDKIQPNKGDGSRTGLIFSSLDFAFGQKMYTQLKDRLKFNPPRSELEKRTLPERFEYLRQFQKQKSDLRHSLLLQIEPDHIIPNAPQNLTPDVLVEAVGERSSSYLISFRDLQEIASSHDRPGFPIVELGNKSIKAGLGVFWPRTEVNRLVGYAPLTEAQKDFVLEIGTGTGVLSLILANRGAKRILATDIDQRAISCAQSNASHVLGNNQTKITFHRENLFHKMRFPEKQKPSLIICNPPWLPGVASSSVERAVFDKDFQMLTGFLRGLESQLRKPDGVAWLVYSNFAELLGLQSRKDLLSMFDRANLTVMDQMETPTLYHKDANKTPDAFHEIRRQEMITLWVLKPKIVKI